MAARNKPKPKKPKRKRASLSERNRRVNGPVVTTDLGPSLDRLRGAGKDLASDDGLGMFGAHQIEAGMVALARGTDALVTKVVNSAREGSRDPADHLLDLSRAYYQEETSEGTHNIQCDRCKLKSPGMATEKQASRLAESLGWVVTDAFDHCPACKDGGLMLPGASAALAVVPALTPAEMIFIVRIRYIVDKIEEGTSVEAFLQNANRSGHRSMLSDLAASTRYDTVPLIDQVTSLIERGADVHPLFSSESTKICSFFFRLHEALKKEDGDAR